MSPVLFFPVFIQINQNIDAPVQPQSLVVAEVGVYFQQAARPDLMQTSAGVVGIGQHAGDSCQCFEKLEHRPAVQEVENIANRRRQLLHRIECQLLALVYVRVREPCCFFGLWEIPERGFRHLDGQEIVKIDMGIGVFALYSSALAWARVSSSAANCSLSNWFSTRVSLGVSTCANSPCTNSLTDSGIDRLRGSLICAGWAAKPLVSNLLTHGKHVKTVGL